MVSGWESSRTGSGILGQPPGTRIVAGGSPEQGWGIYVVGAEGEDDDRRPLRDLSLGRFWRFEDGDVAGSLCA